LILPTDLSQLTLIEVDENYNYVDEIAAGALYDSENDRMYFDAESDKEIRSGHRYVIADSNHNQNVMVEVEADKTAVENVGIDKARLKSGSGTQKEYDTAGPIKLMVIKDQYKVTCISKLGKLINVANDRKTFVVTPHDADDGNVTDKLVFKVEEVNAISPEYELDGAKTPLQFVAYENNGSINTTSFTINGTDEFDTANNAVFGACNLPVTNGNIGVCLESNASEFGSKSFTLTFKANAPIPELTFKADYWVGDSNTTLAQQVNPAVDYTTATYVGEWKDHAYIAQIPAATASDVVDTKLFVTNRSCAAVDPIFKIVLGGKVTEIKASDAGYDNLKPDSQMVYKVGTLVEAAGLPLGKQYAVEIVIPGNAEDFYVYAQALNMSKGQFKDLPVYNTSSRTY
jgi:hypothetical protein